jgi:hypothetical protein
MIILNFSHPIIPSQIEKIQVLSEETIDQVIDIPVQFENGDNFLEQFQQLIQQVPLNADQWQTTPILINLPALNFIAGLMVAELHGRMGYFPPILRTRLIRDSLPPRYEIAEIINLQKVRDHARRSRYVE